MLVVAYDPLMVAASVVVAVMASFTGLRLAVGLGGLDRRRRKIQIARAAFALGGGIWSMHFIAMLALRLPIGIGYDALYTLGSVLIAILMTGLGLSLMFIGDRSLVRTIVAGTLTGLGIVSMHYVGMSAISGNCLVHYVPAGFALSSTIAILFSICALRLAYGRRSMAQLSLGALVLGITIAAMHYSAMAFTHFTAVAEAGFAAPVIQDSYLALIVAISAFVVCGIFLLTALPGESAVEASSMVPATATRTAAGPACGAEAAVAPAEPVDDIEAVPQRVNGGATLRERVRLPYQQHNTIYFVDAAKVQAIKAEGHYTRLYDGKEIHFCPWPISKVEAFLAGQSFLRTHRSFLVNIDHARAFQRSKDKAYLIVPGLEDTPVPVSRFHVAEVRRVLGI